MWRLPVQLVVACSLGGVPVIVFHCFLSFGPQLPEAVGPLAGMAFYLLWSFGAGFLAVFVTGSDLFWWKTLVACPAIYAVAALVVAGLGDLHASMAVVTIILWGAVVLGALAAKRVARRGGVRGRGFPVQPISPAGRATVLGAEAKLGRE